MIGIYLAFVFDASGSIWPGSLTHFLYNGSILLIANGVLNPSWAFDERGFVHGTIVLAALPLAALGIVALAMLKRRRIALLSGTQA